MKSTIFVIAATVSGVALLVFMTAFGPMFSSTENDSKTQQDKIEEYFLRGAISDTSAGKQIPAGSKQYLCGNPVAKSNDFIKEYAVPLPCSQPVGVVSASDGKIWTISTWTGHIMIFDPQTEQYTNFIQIPDWKTKGTFGSMAWSMKFDRSGNLWFTDQVNNSIWRYF